jgi:hypothetical protein
MEGWTCQAVGDGVFQHRIHTIRKRNGLVFGENSNNINEEFNVNAGVFALWSPDRGAPLYFASVQLHNLPECSDKPSRLQDAKKIRS